MIATCPFDNAPMATAAEGKKSLGGFQYEIVRCPQCQFEKKILNTSIDEIYKHVYDEHDFIGLRLIDGGTEPDRVYIKSFLKRFGKNPEKSLMLEVGPGSARNLLYAKNQGYQTATLDVSEANNLYYRTVCQFDQVFNAFDQIADQSVDLILITHVIEHVPEPAAFMKEIYRILRPDGVILVSTPSTKSLFKKLLNYGWWIYDIDDHVSFFNASNLKKLLEQSNFQILDAQSCNTDATHALSSFFLKKDFSEALTATDSNDQTTSQVSSSRQLKALARKMINTVFAPSAFVGLGYEVVCVARRGASQY